MRRIVELIAAAALLGTAWLAAPGCSRSSDTEAARDHRVLILEVMGRDAGWLSLMGGVAGGADVILIPEQQFNVDSIFRKIKRREHLRKRFSIVIIAEGAEPEGTEGQVVAEAEVDAFGHARLGGVGQYVAPMGLAIPGGCQSACS